MRKRLQAWAQKQVVKDAITARERGESTYVRGVVAPGEDVRNHVIAAIEAEGWKLTHVRETPDNPRERATLTFRRADLPDQPPPPTPAPDPAR